MWRVRNLGVIVSSCLLAACPSSGDALDPDAGPDDDSGPPAGGFTIAIHSKDQIPQTDGDVRITDVRLHTTTIRALGDATTGDDQTTKSDFELRWDDRRSPMPFTFAMAPTGRYSQIEIRIAADDGSSAGLTIEGEAKVDGDFEPFLVDLDSGVVVASVEINEMLAPGGTTTVDLEADLVSLLQAIDFDAVPTDDGVHVIDDARPEMIGIRFRLATMFDTSGD
ncbi:MAG: hypothetical protein ABI867_38330 [Kofleriaceae bacterium]